VRRAPSRSPNPHLRYVRLRTHFCVFASVCAFVRSVLFTHVVQAIDRRALEEVARHVNAFVSVASISSSVLFIVNNLAIA
jgi:hypothetical protein